MRVGQLVLVQIDAQQGWIVTHERENVAAQGRRFGAGGTLRPPGLVGVLGAGEQVGAVAHAVAIAILLAADVRVAPVQHIAHGVAEGEQHKGYS